MAMILVFGIALLATGSAGAENSSTPQVCFVRHEENGRMNLLPARIYGSHGAREELLATLASGSKKCVAVAAGSWSFEARSSHPYTARAGAPNACRSEMLSAEIVAATTIVVSPKSKRSTYLCGWQLGSPKPTVIYVCGNHPRGWAMARIEARSPGTRGHALKVIEVSGPRPTPPPKSPHIVNLHCSTHSYSFDKDTDVFELRPGPFSLTVEAERLFPYPSAFTPASVFEIHADVTVRGGRCYEPVMTCEGEATDSATCHLTLKQKSCAPLRSPRRIVLPSTVDC